MRNQFDLELHELEQSFFLGLGQLVLETASKNLTGLSLQRQGDGRANYQ